MDQVTPEEVFNAQKDCRETHNLRQGFHNKNIKIKDINFGKFQLLCEVSNKPRPILPLSLRHKVIKCFHSLDHSGQAESTRRTAENFYWKTTELYSSSKLN